MNYTVNHKSNSLIYNDDHISYALIYDDPKSNSLIYNDDHISHLLVYNDDHSSLYNLWPRYMHQMSGSAFSSTLQRIDMKG